MIAGGAVVSTLPLRLLMIGIEVANSSPGEFFFSRVTGGRGNAYSPPPTPPKACNWLIYMNSEAIMVLTACPDAATAARIASQLVESGLAACVSRVGSIRSTYRWEGQLQDEPEVLLIVKTLAERYQALEMRLKSLHPYDVPEIIAIPVVNGSSDYLSWLRTALS